MSHSLAMHPAGPEPALPGLSLTPEQLFFLSFGQIWCASATPFEVARRLAQDPHSPAMFRVIGAVQNSADFANAYQCSPGSPMNPVDKCVVW
jgi:membrane metallo-endopeptidase-like protein 1